MATSPRSKPDLTPEQTVRFSGRRILVLAVLAGALTGPGQTIGVSVFVPHLVADLGLSDAAVAGAYMAGTLLGALAMPRIGGWIDRTGVRRAMGSIGAAFGAALIAMSGVWAVVPLAIGFTFIRMFGQGALMLVSSVAVSHWFDRRRGIAMGLMTTSVAMLMSLVPVALTAAIAVWGWRGAWAAAGVVIWATVIPIGWVGMIDRPSDVGQVPDGHAHAVVGTAEPPQMSMTRSQAMRTRAFWVAMAAVATQSMLLTALNFHQIRLLGEVGLSAAEAAIMFVPQVIGSTVASLTFGFLADRWRGGLVLAVAMVLMAIPLVLVAGLDSYLSIVVYSVLLGSAGGSLFTANAALLPRWFGVAHVGAIAGVATFVMVAASSLGPLALSIVRSVAGSYAAAGLVFVAVPLFVALVAAITGDPKRAPAPAVDT